MRSRSDRIAIRPSISELVPYGTRKQAHDLDEPNCYLRKHPIPSGQYYVPVKLTGGERYAVCFPCANPHCPTTRKWFPPDDKSSGTMFNLPGS